MTRSFMYMPFACSSYQKMKTASAADKLVMVECPANALLVGATAWEHYSPVTDAQQLLRLFNCVLDLAATMQIEIGLETVVSETNWTKVCNKELSSNLEPVAFRLWLALDGAQHAIFISTVSAMLAVVVEEGGGGRPSKMARTEPVPLYRQKVTTKEELTVLLRLYWDGRLGLDQELNINGGACGEDTIDDAFDEPIPASQSANVGLLSDFLSAETFFTSPQKKRCWANRETWGPQTKLGSYTSGGDTLYPCDEIRLSGLFRWFRVGQGYMLPLGSASLADCLLPHVEPSLARVQNKFASLWGNVGLPTDKIHTMSIKELVQFDEQTTSGGGKSMDPFLYSPLTCAETEVVCGTSTGDIVSASGQRIANSIYFVLTALKGKTLTTFEKHLEKNDLEAMYQHHSGVVQSLYSLLATGTRVEGLPVNYGKCYCEWAELWRCVRTPEDRVAKLARRYFMGIPSTKVPYSRCGKQLLKLTFGAANCSGLISQQKLVFLLAYLTGFRLLKNDMEEPSSSFALVGPPDTGKSEGTKRFAECCPVCLVVQAESQSALALTAIGSDYDFTFWIRDELRTMQGQPGAGDQTTSDADKMIQSLLSQKFVYHRTKYKDVNTGKWALQTEVSLARLVHIGGTNAVGNLSDAFLSRTTTIALTAANTDSHHARRAHTSLNVATATDPDVLARRRGFVMSSRLTMAATVRLWALHAVGVVPSLSTILFSSFIGILSVKYPALNLPPRKICDLRTLAEGVCVFDRVTTWYTELGKQYEYDSVVESLWYASSAFVTAEHCCTAFQILDQGNTTAAQLREVAAMVKTQIKFCKETDLPITHKLATGVYYELSPTKKMHMMSMLRASFSGFGLGLLNRLWTLLQESTTGGASNLMVMSIDGQDKMLVHAGYINDAITSIRTPAELAILKALHRLSLEPEYQTSAFEDESFLVFASKIRTSVFTPHQSGSGLATSVNIPELADYTAQNISLAISFLRRVEADGKPLFSTPDMIQGCQYAPSESDHPMAEVSTLDPLKKKIPCRKVAPMVVSRLLLKQALGDQSSISPASALCIDALSIGSSRYRNYAIFTGPAAPGSDALNQSLLVPANHSVTVKIKNPFYCSTSVADDMYGEETGDTDYSTLVLNPDLPVRNAIFPPEKQRVDLTSGMEIETKLADTYVRRTPAEYQAVFKEYL